MLHGTNDEGHGTINPMDCFNRLDSHNLSKSGGGSRDPNQVRLFGHQNNWLEMQRLSSTKCAINKRGGVCGDAARRQGLPQLIWRRR
ncbi:MAG: hypothetical protein HYU44_13920 [Betaproteobacteria bacterium]|nr:hypothetical protein [Betaproteobacteria bacterium]